MRVNRWLGCVGIVLLALFCLGIGVGGGVILDRQVLAVFSPPSNIPAGATDDFKLIAEAWNVIDRVYVDREAVQAQRLTYGALSGMTDALGDTGHSRFLTPEMVKAESDFAKGEFEGIGAEVQAKDNHVVIVAPLDDSPALRAGLKPGDIIQKVNGEDVTGQPIGQVISKVLGPAGSVVTLTVVSGATAQSAGKTREVVITRARVVLQNVTWQQLPGTTVAHLRLSAFSQGIGRDLQQALREIQAARLTGIVLDLRSNPGGLLDEAVTATSQFLSSGDVLQVKDAQGTISSTPVQKGGLATDIPLVVLIDNGSASAAEIMAGAIQDAGRAKLLGETTFGTGTVLNTFSLSDGSALLMATKEWLTPKGRVIWHQGIAPDIQVPLPADAETLRPTTERQMTAQELGASSDAQLLQALRVLGK